jgi:hypothetical protein
MMRAIGRNERQVVRYNRQEPQKKAWTEPKLEVLHINVAEGANAGPKCDKHGSVSNGPGCS